MARTSAETPTAVNAPPARETMEPRQTEFQCRASTLSHCQPSGARLETATDSLIERIDQLVEAGQVAAEWGSPHLSVTPIPLAIETLAAEVEALQQAVREIALEVQKLSAQG